MVDHAVAAVGRVVGDASSAAFGVEDDLGYGAPRECRAAVDQLFREGRLLACR